MDPMWTPHGYGPPNEASRLQGYQIWTPYVSLCIWTPYVSPYALIAYGPVLDSAPYGSLLDAYGPLMDPLWTPCSFLSPYGACVSASRVQELP